ncbi:MAG TPA: glycosyltransferase family 4 protein [Myxococcaceae bacterium]|jgi:glycosyltransferase involved in cell wall biosynthesis
MKVLMTADAVGGVWTYVLELARALAPSGVEVVVAIKGGQRLSADQRAAARLANVRMFESAFKLEWQEEPWEDVHRAGEWLLGLEAQVQPDVIHLNDFAHGDLPFRAPVLVVGHSCVLSWWEAVKKTALPPEWQRYRNAVRAGIRGADAVVAPSSAMLAALERHYGPLPFARVIYNGRALEEGGDPPGPRKRLVLAAGRIWDEGKNIAQLAKVASRVDWPIAVAGEARGMSLPGLKKLGPLSHSDLATWLRRAAIYALPVRYEPFGLSILEAALAGCALVVGDIPSQRELWGGAAEFVPPDDVEALAAALQLLTLDGPRRATLAAAARRRATRYAPDRMAAGYAGLYLELARRSHAGSVEGLPVEQGEAAP